MIRRASMSLSCALIVAGCAGHVDAPSHAPSTPSVADSAARADGARDRADATLAAAIDAASRGSLDDTLRAGIAQHPARAWVEYARLRRDIDIIAPGEAEAFLAAHANDAVGRSFREDWIAALSRRKEWPRLLDAWQPTIERATLRCMALNARLQSDQADAAWMQQARQLWLNGKPLAAECAPVVEGWQARGGLDDGLRWQRIDLAIAENQPAVMREAAQGLPDAARAQALAYANAMGGTLGDAASGWSRDARSRTVATAALVAMAKKSPPNAEAALPKFAPMLGLDDAQRGRVLYEIALQSAASYEPEAARRLGAVPEAAYDERLAELRVREAMARRDWPSALRGIERLPGELRDSARWRYLRARLLEVSGGDAATARALYAQAAMAPEFHGFLAADRLGARYPLCPWQPAPQPALQQQVAATPALQRALALYRIDRRDWAMREWRDALAGFDAERRRIAIALAQDSGWFDRAVFDLAREDRQELRLYELRFPIHHVEAIERAAKQNRIDAQWIAAEIRAESLFDPRARSPADASGLMQVLPSTGQAVAQRIGLPWQGAASLYDSETNIAIGSAYLREMLDRWGALPQAIAAYNAGPAPTTRWQSQRGDMDPALWIETITYKETREYVARILAFSVIYDWRMHGDALRVSDRMAGKLDGTRVAFACPDAGAPR